MVKEIIIIHFHPQPNIGLQDVRSAWLLTSTPFKLTFANVGDTPQNKYNVFVDLKDNLVKQWAYYNEASRDTANFVRPWDNYNLYGKILLSSDRSDDRGPKNVKVDEMLDDKLFLEF